MEYVIGIIVLLIGLITLGLMAIKELKAKDIETYWKIMIAASAGAFVTGGVILLIL